VKSLTINVVSILAKDECLPCSINYSIRLIVLVFKFYFKSETQNNNLLVISYLIRTTYISNYFLAKLTIIVRFKQEKMSAAHPDPDPKKYW